MRKTAQESQESGRWQKARLFDRRDFKTAAFNRSATLPCDHEELADRQSLLSGGGALPVLSGGSPQRRTRVPV
jgi:hypothetical protein